MPTHKIDVIMPVKNRMGYVAEAISSIQKQSFESWHLFVVDNGSTDATIEVVSRFLDDPRISLHHNERANLPELLNYSIGLGQAPWIARMDSDDVSSPKRFERLLAIFEQYPSTSIASANLYFCDERLNVHGKKEQLRLDPLEIRRFMLIENTVMNGVSLMKRKPVEMAGGYDVGFEIAEDYDLWLRLHLKHEMRNINEPLYYYRKHGGSSLTDRRKLHYFTGIARLNQIARELGLPQFTPQYGEENFAKLPHIIEQFQKLKMRPIASKALKITEQRFHKFNILPGRGLSFG